MAKSLAVFWNSCPLPESFWAKNEKFDFSLRKRGLEFSLYKLEVYVFINWSSRLEKHQTIEILLRVEFLLIFKILHFCDFSRFLVIQ